MSCYFVRLRILFPHNSFKKLAQRVTRSYYEYTFVGDRAGVAQSQM